MSRDILVILSIQATTASLFLLLLLSISSDYASVVLYCLGAVFISGAALTVATHPDLGIVMALFGPVFGLLIFMPFLIPVEDPVLLEALWPVWVVVTVISVQAREAWKNVLWSSAAAPAKLDGRVIVSVEVLGSSAVLLLILPMTIGFDPIRGIFSILLAIILPLMSWFLMPLTREVLDEPDAFGQSNSQSADAGGKSSESNIGGRKRQPVAGIAIGLLFVLGLFLPMSFAVNSDISSDYVLGGILFVDAAILRAAQGRARTSR